MTKPLVLGITIGLLLFGVLAVLWAVAPATSVQAKSSDGLASPYVVSDVVVHYRVYWGDERKGMNTVEGTPVQTMIIRQNSIILIEEGGGGRLLPINDSLRSFSWKKP